MLGLKPKALRKSIKLCLQPNILRSEFLIRLEFIYGNCTWNNQRHGKCSYFCDILNSDGSLFISYLNTIWNCSNSLSSVLQLFYYVVYLNPPHHHNLFLSHSLRMYFVVWFLDALNKTKMLLGRVGNILEISFQCALYKILIMWETVCKTIL